uniref:Uncharacterized protein n=1 Tax=Oryza meridionalis TaxID=40149 RepID=A0A0E0CS84_9ORYZ
MLLPRSPSPAVAAVVCAVAIRCRRHRGCRRLEASGPVRRLPPPPPPDSGWGRDLRRLRAASSLARIWPAGWIRDPLHGSSSRSPSRAAATVASLYTVVVVAPSHGKRGGKRKRGEKRKERKRRKKEQQRLTCG